jgi:hypothetical protein
MTAGRIRLVLNTTFHLPPRITMSSTALLLTHLPTHSPIPPSPGTIHLQPTTIPEQPLKRQLPAATVLSAVTRGVTWAHVQDTRARPALKLPSHLPSSSAMPVATPAVL